MDLVRSKVLTAEGERQDPLNRVALVFLVSVTCVSSSPTQSSHRSLVYVCLCTCTCVHMYIPSSMRMETWYLRYVAPRPSHSLPPLPLFLYRPPPPLFLRIQTRYECGSMDRKAFCSTVRLHRSDTDTRYTRIQHRVYSDSSGAEGMGLTSWLGS